MDIKDWVLRDLDSFLDIATNYETALKFFSVTEGRIRAEVYLKTAMISYEGELSTFTTKKLLDTGFAEAEMRETRRMEELG